MCGIFGLIGTRWREQAREALDTLHSRGPDASGLATSGAAVLGHRRLAIIDLAGGAQPMQSDDGRWTLVFNGEIYNYRELRQELEASGWPFHTHSDTEVLLQGWRAWGERLLDRLDGIFAFALWDVQSQELILARDRIGIKPLFYAEVDGGLVFASTLAPFYALTGFPRRLDYAALRDYLACQSVQSPHTILRDVRQLPPAHQLTYRHPGGPCTLRGYWRPAVPGRSTAPSFEDALIATDAAIRESVRRQLVADVPLGAFLSGGIDSSLMVHYMAEAGARPLRTFNIRFAEAGFDETPAARAVAERYGCDHRVIEAPAIDAARFEAAIASLDQPLADPAFVATDELSRLTRQAVTVAISGDGGDELFAGYPRFADGEDRFPDSAMRRLLRAGSRAGWLPGSLLRRGLAGQEMLLYRHVELGPFPRSRKDFARFLHPDVLAACQPENTLELWRRLAQGERGMDTASLMRADLWTYLSEDCLVKTDRASMAQSLEVRVPLLGNPVLDQVLEWPAEVHYDADGGKALLRALARRHLPETVWNRPKHGFSIPLQHYFNGQWNAACEHYIARCEELAPFLDAVAVQRLWQAAKRRKASRRLAYTFVVLLIWLAAHPLTP